MKKSLRILYVGGLYKGSTGLERFHTIEELGHDVVTFDSDPYLRQGNRIARSLTHRLAWGPRVWSLNRSLVEFARNLEYDLAWVSKGIWYYPDTIDALKRNGQARVLHFTPDPAIMWHRTRHFIRSIPIYDVCITTKHWEVERYKEAGAQRVVYVPKAASLELFHPHDVSDSKYDSLRSDVCLIGHHETHYRQCIKVAVDTGADVAVWGGHWNRVCLFHPWLKQAVRGKGIWHEDYVRALCCAKIGLGLLSKYVPETATARTFQIPASGTFLLAERTEEHMQYFEEGKEAEFFGNEKELRDKIKYYLAHPDERERIAAAGMKRCHNSGYGNIDRMRQCIEAVYKKP